MKYFDSCFRWALSIWLLVFIWVFALSACGNICADTEEETSQGICTDLKNFPIDINMVSEIVDLSLRRTSERFGYSISDLQSSFDATSIHFIDHFRNEKLDKEADGVTQISSNWNTYVLGDNKYKIQVKFHWNSDFNKIACWTWHILEHELLHEYVDITVGYPSGKHDGDSAAMHPKYWFSHKSYSDEENTDNLEMQISREIYFAYCPEVLHK